jgi:Arc/MetJ family transcription regulator
MRTTLILNDELVAEAKRRAADRQTSLSTVVNDALRKALQSGPEIGESVEFSIPTYRPRKARRLDTSPKELHELVAAEESAPYRV